MKECDCKKQQTKVIPLLQKEMEKCGYISQEAIEKISETTKVSCAEIYGVVTFYSQFGKAGEGRGGYMHPVVNYRRFSAKPLGCFGCIKKRGAGTRPDYFPVNQNIHFAQKVQECYIIAPVGTVDGKNGLFAVKRVHT